MMRVGRSFVLDFLLLATFVLLGLSDIQLVYADDSVEGSTGGPEPEAEVEAEIDAAGNVLNIIEESELTKEEDGHIRDAKTAAKEAVDVAEARQAEADAREAEADARQAVAEAAAAMAAEAKAAAEASLVDEVGETIVEASAISTSPTAWPFAHKMKEVTPERMKKIAAGALGIWGVAAGAGWVMNNLGGAQAQE